MAWASIHQTHAIERVRFEVQFAENLPMKAVEALGQMFDRLDGLRFGPRTPHHSGTFAIAISADLANTQPKQLTGWMATRVATKHNRALEAVIVNPAALVYESSDYRGWTTALERFRSVTQDLLSEAGKLVNAGIVAHDYTDRFVFSGNPSEASPTGVIKTEILAQLPPNVLAGSQLWHLHKGWFELLEGELYLANQNFDAQDGTTEFGKPARSVQIYTKFEYRPTGAGVDMSTIESKIQIMHSRCNQLVADALTDDMAAKVGLAEAPQA